jgi:HD-GYP domain-containing protein (c-di-GMP phosphodiesterase class II)/ABC-type amino acid transport substrate-binding protein
MAAPEKKHWRLSFRLTVVSMFIIITALTAAVAIGLQYYFSTRMATNAALKLYREAAARTSDYLATEDNRAVSATRFLAAYGGLVAHGHITARTRNAFADTLERNPHFYATYVGFDGGNFYELIKLGHSAEVRHQLKALPQDRWVSVRISGDGVQRKRQLRYYDAHFRLRASRSEPSTYRADSRPWFIHAGTGTVYKTAPYLFQLLQKPGQTYATRIAGQHAVLAVDITLSSLSQGLSHQAINHDSRIYLYRGSGELIASSAIRHRPAHLPPARPLALSPAQRRMVAETPVLTVSNETDWPPIDFTVSGKPYGYAIDMLSLVGQMTGLRFHYVNGYAWPELVKMFRQGRLDILQPLLRTGDNMQLGQPSQPFLSVPFGVLTRKGMPPVTRISQLFGKRVAIPAGWSIIATLRRDFPQVHIVEAKGVQGMFDVVRQGKVDAALDTAAQLRYTAQAFFYNDVAIDAPLDFGKVDVPTGLHYAVQPSRHGVVDLIDLALAHVTDAQRRALRARWLMQDDVSQRQRATVPYAQLITLAADPAALNRLQRIRLGGVPRYVYLQAIGQGDSRDYFAVVAPVASVLAPAIHEVKTALVITGAILLLLLPLASWLASMIARPVRQLAAENEKLRQQRYGEIRRVDSHIVEVDDLARSLLAMATATERHAKEQEALMDAFIQLIAQAIDDKSPYTGAHCARVPELAMLLAKKAEESDETPFDHFRFADDKAWREFRIGAWLHDCGKIITPEHVIDKGSKLETIYDRIHEIRMRFEVLWRDAEIACLRACAEAPGRTDDLKRQLAQRQAELTEQFAFVAACNRGGESMEEADIERLEALASITWQRHFDDRLGLSQSERARFGDEAEVLPATEQLLADKPWHIIARTRKHDLDPRLGIRMQVPQHLYNRGELYNLKVRRGTLTPEERFKINGHMIGTIKMLDSLPLPKELARMPRYASTHHETLDGRGYPRGLTGADLSIPERIMVLADIFEALTASDRPYKTAKPISEAIGILHDMVENQHVDRDVFHLFLKSGAWLEYARRFLSESQIDDVDLDRYLSPQTA